MRDFNEENITAAVLDSFADTPDVRLKEILGSLVRRLHDFVRDVEQTFAEWSCAVGDSSGRTVAGRPWRALRYSFGLKPTGPRPERTRGVSSVSAM